MSGETRHNILLTPDYSKEIGSRREHGFTLLELLIALTIFTIGILGVATMFDMSHRSGGTAKNLLNANRLAKSMMETLYSRGYSDTLTGMPPVTISGNTKTASRLDIAENLSYTTTVRVDENYVTSGAITVNRVFVTVSWSEKGIARQVQAETFL